jgi:ABC-type enterochelin transport system ATPase subunit
MKEEITIEEQKKQMTSIVMTTGDGRSRQLSVYDCAQIIKQQHDMVREMRQAMAQLQEQNQILKQHIHALQSANTINL